MAETTVERLVIDVKTNAGSAAAQFKQLAVAMNGINGGAKSVAKSAKSAAMPLGNFVSSLKRIAFYRFVRGIIKSISKAFSEGLKNAYNFSKGIGGTLAAALDSLATKSLTMKNQLGAAFGNLLHAIMPIVLRIVELIRQLAQAISALFSALGGGDYLVAKDVEQSWDAATGAAQKYKNTILGFDEINRLDAPGGGGGGSAVDASNMFVKAELPEWAKTIADHFKTILDTAIAIGVAIAGWHIAQLLTHFKKINLSTKQLYGLAMAAAGAFLLIKGFVDALSNGVNWDNLIEMIGGVALAAGGLALAFGHVAAGIGLLVGGVTLLVAGFTDWLKTGELTTESFVALEAGLLAVGGGIALLTGSWIPLLIGAIAGIALAVYKYWDQIKAWTKTTWDTVKEKISTAMENAKTKAEEKLEGIKNFFSDELPKIVEETKQNFTKIPENLGKALGRAFGTLVSWGAEINNWTHNELPVLIEEMGAEFGKLSAKVKITFDLIDTSLDEWIDAAFTWVEEEIPKFIQSIVDWFDTLPDKLNNIGKDMISNLWEGIKEKWNSLVDKFAGLGTAIGGVFGDFGKGFTAGYNSVEIKQWATGGFPDQGSLFVAGEAGAELVSTSSSGQTQVSNTNQIAASVSVGNVGVVQAINDLIRAVENKDTSPVVTIGDRDVYRASQRGQQKVGRSLVATV